MHTFLRSRPTTSSFTITSATSASIGCIAYAGGRGIEEARRGQPQQNKQGPGRNPQEDLEHCKRILLPNSTQTTQRVSTGDTERQKGPRNGPIRCTEHNSVKTAEKCYCSLATGGASHSTAHFRHKRQLGEFYVRFYSTMAGNGWVNDGRPQRTATKERQAPSSTSNWTSTQFNEPSWIKGSLEERKEANIKNGNHGESEEFVQNDNINQPSRHLANSKSYVEKGHSSATQNDIVDGSRHLGHTPRSIKPVFVDPIASVHSTVRVTDSMLEHQKLGDYLRLRLVRKLEERDRLQAGDGYWDRQAELTYDIEMMKDTWRHINERTGVQSAEALQNVQESESDAQKYSNTCGNPSSIRDAVKGASIKVQRDYIPPFPNYSLDRPPILLNMSLRRLMSQRPVPMNLIPKVCFNLLTSKSAPDNYTYNILIHNFVLLRQNTLAEIVFQEMIKSGLKPDEYTIVALLNLMAKTGDFIGWKKIATLQRLEEVSGKNPDRRGKSKHLIETLIIHSARFGDRQNILKYTRALKSYCPEDPEPGVNVSTAMLRFYAENREWLNGRRYWIRLLNIEAAAKKEAFEIARSQPGGENTSLESISVDVIDERAWYWWLWHCERCGRQLTMDRWANIARERGINVDKLIVEGPEKTKGLPVRSSNKSPALGEHTYVGDWFRELQRKPGQLPGVFVVSMKHKRMFQKKLNQVVFKAMLRPRTKEPTSSEVEEIERKLSGKIAPSEEISSGQILEPRQTRPTSVTCANNSLQEVEPPLQSDLTKNSSPLHPRPPKIVTTTGYHDLTWDALEETMPPSKIDTFTTLHKLKPKPPSTQSFVPKSQTTDLSILSRTPLVSEAQKAIIWQNLLTRRLDVLLSRQKALHADSLNGNIRLTTAEERRGRILERWRRDFRDKDEEDENQAMGPRDHEVDPEDRHYGKQEYEDDEDELTMGVRPLRRRTRKTYI